MRKSGFAALVVLFAGCSAPGPGEDTIREQVGAHLLADGKDQFYDVQNVHIVKGELKTEEEYIAEVGYDLRFKVDSKEAVQVSRQFVAGLRPEALGLTLRYGQFRAGGEREAVQKYTFTRSGENWRLSDVIGQPRPRN